jgi:outer membrane protein TolC
MHQSRVFFFFCFSILFSYPFFLPAQVLSLKQAVQTGLSNYGILKAKQNYLVASRYLVKESRKEYLPDLSISGQQEFGTVNAQNGPLYGYRGLGVASSGPILASQNWNAAFGALYLSNINWDFFAFGKAKERVKLANSAVDLFASDLEQEKFQHEIRVSGAYLNLLAAQRLRKSQRDNLERTLALMEVVLARARNGLNPGVDSALAGAEVSNARIALTDALDNEMEQSNILARLMGIAAPDSSFVLDSFFVKRIPASLYDSLRFLPGGHPILKFYQSRVLQSDALAKYYQTLAFPVFSLFGILQTRGSGFQYDYGAQNPQAYSHGYWNGVNPGRGNYLLGLGVTWNLTNPLRVQSQVEAQKLVSRGLRNELDQTSQDLSDQLKLSESKIRNAVQNHLEAPIQVRAASDAFTQKTVMYKNGLSTIVDLTQALFTLNRAETEQEIADNNVWQALLLKAAALGDFGIFMNEL